MKTFKDYLEMVKQSILESTSAPLSIDNFEIEKANISDSIRKKAFYITYKNGTKEYSGIIKIGYGSKGRDVAYSYVDEIEWDDETPDNWEDIELFIDQHLDIKIGKLDK